MNNDDEIRNHNQIFFYVMKMGLEKHQKLKNNNNKIITKRVLMMIMTTNNHAMKNQSTIQ